MLGVTGATGEVGGRVARRLADAGIAQRLVVRDAARAPQLPGAEVRVASGYADTAQMRAALEGVDTLFLIPGTESRERVAEHVSAIDAALAAGVRHVVYLSYLGASAHSTFTLGTQHAATEEHILATGCAFTFLRMSLFMDFIPGMVGADGAIRGPAGQGRVAAILRDDIAAAANAVLASAGEHEGRTYDLTGPRAFSLEEAARLLSRPGREVRYVDETLEEAYRSREAYGAPDWEVEGWVTSYLAVARGELDVVSADVARLTGREPVSLEQYLAVSPR